jgi:hypothetical protein
MRPMKHSQSIGSNSFHNSPVIFLLIMIVAFVDVVKLFNHNFTVDICDKLLDLVGTHLMIMMFLLLSEYKLPPSNNDQSPEPFQK